MQYAIAVALFAVIYEIIVTIPFIVILIAYEALTNKPFAEAPDLPKAIVFAALLVLWLAAGLRAKLAADVNVHSQKGLIDSHVASGPMLRSQLSFLPIIGKLFNSRKEDQAE